MLKTSVTPLHQLFQDIQWEKLYARVRTTTHEHLLAVALSFHRTDGPGTDTDLAAVKMAVGIALDRAGRGRGRSLAQQLDADFLAERSQDGSGGFDDRVCHVSLSCS